jgi:hypothetical protein
VDRKGKNMIKVRISPPRFEILFWDVIFWVMKLLQRLRDRWLELVYFIQPKIRLHIFLLILIACLGLGLGFAFGYFRASWRGW